MISRSLLHGAGRLALGLLLTLAACDGDSGDSSPPAAASVAEATMVVASEFDPYPVVEQQLALLAPFAPKIALGLAIRQSESQSPALAQLLRAAAEKNIPVIGWLLLEESEGYWFNEDNFEAAEAQTLAFIAWIESEELPLQWLMFDMEMSLQKSRALETVEDVQDIFNEVVPMLQANRDPAAFEAATARYAQLVGQVKSRGYVVTAAAYPFILDDFGDGDADIQDAFDTPIEGVGFDEIYFMAYRSSFESLLGMLPGPDIVYQYAQTAQESFGPKAVMGLGIVGGIGQLADPGFDQPSELAPDVAAARAGGANPRVFIFSLDGMVASGHPEEWLALVDTPPTQPDADNTTTQVRGVFSLLDSLLESAP